MNDKLFNELLESVKQAGEIMRGKRKPSRVFVRTPGDVRSIRADMGVSQSEFARMMSVSVDTLQNWEQGRRKPSGPAAALLLLAAKVPQVVRTVLAPSPAAAAV